MLDLDLAFAQALEALRPYVAVGGCRYETFTGFARPYDVVGYTWGDCVVYIRVGALGVDDFEVARCVFMHEIGHSVVGGWHSDDPKDLMYPVSDGDCGVTEDFKERVK